MFKASSVSHVGDTIKYFTAQYLSSILTITTTAAADFLDYIVTASSLCILHIPVRIRFGKRSTSIIVLLWVMRRRQPEKEGSG